MEQSRGNPAWRRCPSWLDVPRLLSYFAQDGGDPLQRYREFVAAEL